MRRTLLALAIASLSLASAADLRVGYYRGHQVTFKNVDGLAVYQGDIILGATTEIESAQPTSKTRESTTVTAEYLWPGGVIPYEINPTDSPDSKVVQQAVDYWNSHTPIHLQQRAGETSYVRFSKGTSTIACSSNVG